MNLHQEVPRRDGFGAHRGRDRTEDIETALAAVDQLSRQILHLQEEERQRIAVELHDATAQHLTAIGLNLMNLRRMMARDKSIASLVEDMEASLYEAQKEIRVFSYLLHPPHLEEDGLKSTMRRFIEGFSRRAGLEVDAKIPAAIDGVAIDLQRCILRIVQEALANVHRHASATRAVIRAALRTRTISIRIADDGKGMGRVREIPLGLGLPGMRARLALFGGRLKVHSNENGTEIAALIPLPGRRQVQRPARTSSMTDSQAGHADTAARPAGGILSSNRVGTFAKGGRHRAAVVQPSR